MFNKTNLMTGDLVITANNKKATVMRNTNIGDILRFHTEKDSFSYLERRYNEDLTHKTVSGLSIVKVYRVNPDTIEASKIGDLIANPEKMIQLGKVVFDVNERRRTATAIDNLDTPKSETERPTIESLMTGDMLVHSNGKVSTVYKDTPFGDVTRYHTEKNSFSYLYKFDNETLEHENDDYNIIAVFRAPTDLDNAGDYIANPKKMIRNENNLWSTGSFTAEYWYKGEDGEIDYPIYEVF